MIDRLLFSLKGIRSALAHCSAYSFFMALLIVGQAFLLTQTLTNLWHGQNLEAQIPYLAGFAICFILRQVIENIQSSWLDTYATTRADEFRQTLLKKGYSAGRPLIQQQGTGNFATLIIEGVDRVEAYIRMMLPRMTRLVIVPVILLVLIFVLDWVSGVIALLVFPAIILQMVLIGHTASLEAGKQHTEYQRLANHFLDSVRGIDTLKLFGRSQDQAERIYESSKRFRHATMKTLRIATLSGAVLDAFSTISIAAIAVMLGFRLVDGSLTLFPALFVLVLIPDYFKPIREFASDYHASLDGKNTLHSITELLDDSGQPADDPAASLTNSSPAVTPSNATFPSTTSSSSLPLASSSNQLVIPSWTPTSCLSLQKISFAYPGHTALTDINCTFRGIQKIAIVGASGSGKSTLAHLLAGITASTSGTLQFTADITKSPNVLPETVHPALILNSLAYPSWHQQVSYIPQNPYIFHASLRDNLTFYEPQASQQDIESVVHLMGLEGLVQELPNGLNTVIGEGAHAISGGQAQRIAFARAFLYKSCRVLIFDEPTAHLDIETELELKEHMLTLMKNKLVFLATHRLHWLPDADHIVFLRNGCIEAQGTLAELKQNDAFTTFVSDAKGSSHV